MPVFHTKIIESILDPVAQQVSRLVILHEEAEDGNAMPDLARPVHAVSLAVNNLVKVGHETIESSEDYFLRQDMPSALHRVESAASYLQQASDMLRSDPFSGPARKKLIEGSRGILQGTSALLLCFDESEVRKIVNECKKVLEYLSVSEVLDSMEELVEFLRDVSPALSLSARDVCARAKELTHAPHAHALTTHIDNVKRFAPLLICAIKLYIQVRMEGGKGLEDASLNRNYIAQRMSDEIHEIIRVLQLTSYVEDGGQKDNIAVLKALQAQINNKMAAAQEFLNDPSSLRNSSGERALRSILASAQSAAEHLDIARANDIKNTVRSGGANTDNLCDERQFGRGRESKALNLANDVRSQLHRLQGIVNEGVQQAEKHGGNTMQARLDRAYKWLSHPGCDPATRTEGQRAINSIVQQGQIIADGLQGREKAEILNLCSDVQRLNEQLADLCSNGKGNTEEARAVARQLMDKLNELKRAMESAVLNRVLEDFIDVLAPIRRYTEAVNLPIDVPDRDVTLQQRGRNLSDWSNRAVNTAQLLANTKAYDKPLADALLHHAKEVDGLTPQVISAGKIRFQNPESKVSEEHFNNLKDQLSEAALKLRDQADQAMDPLDFIKTAAELMQKHTFLCEDAIRNNDSQKMVDNTSAIARLGNRVLLVGNRERENTLDHGLSSALEAASSRLQRALPAAVSAAKAVAMGDHSQDNIWRGNNREILNATRELANALESTHSPPPPPPPPLSPAKRERERENIPSRPPPPRPPLPDTDDEGDDVFRAHPHPSQPILVAAHNLHSAVREWSSKDNEIIAAAKKMAILMARLSELVRSDSKGSKRELIATAKAIAEASEEVTRLAKKLAMECTDKRIRTNLLQVCERIPTIGTQLKILSTVKATMLGAQGTEEDQEATDMLVGNAQNLMQSVKETVKAAEGASIKIRSEQGGYRMQWVRKSPWYQV